MRKDIKVLDLYRVYLGDIFSKALQIARNENRQTILVRDIAMTVHWFPKPGHYCKICVSNLRILAQREGVNRISREALYYLRNYLEKYKI